MPKFNDNEWIASGIYSKWFGFTLYEEKEITFDLEGTNDWGLKTFQETYKIRQETNISWTSLIHVKSTCLAITPAGLGKDRTHAAGIWKIEAIRNADMNSKSS